MQSTRPKTFPKQRNVKEINNAVMSMIHSHPEALTPIKRFVIPVKITISKTQETRYDRSAKAIGLVCENNIVGEMPNRYVVFSQVALASPYAEFNFSLAKHNHETINHDIYEATLLPLKLSINQFVKSKEAKKPCEFTISIPVGTNSLLRDHYVSLFVTLRYDANGNLTYAKGELKDPKYSSNPFARFYNYMGFEYLKSSLKKLFPEIHLNNFVELLNQQSARNEIDCGYHHPENVYAHIAGQPYPSDSNPFPHDGYEDNTYHKGKLTLPADSIVYPTDKTRAHDIELQGYYLEDGETEKLSKFPEQLVSQHAATKTKASKEEITEVNEEDEHVDEITVVPEENNQSEDLQQLIMSTQGQISSMLNSARENTARVIERTEKEIIEDRLKQIRAIIHVNFIKNNPDQKDNIENAWQNLANYIEAAVDKQKREKLLEILEKFTAVNDKTIHDKLLELVEDCNDATLAHHRNFSFIKIMRGKTDATMYLTDFKDAIAATSNALSQDPIKPAVKRDRVATTTLPANSLDSRLRDRQLDAPAYTELLSSHRFFFPPADEPTHIHTGNKQKIESSQSGQHPSQNIDNDSVIVPPAMTASQLVGEFEGDVQEKNPLTASELVRDFEEDVEQEEANDSKKFNT